MNHPSYSMPARSTSTKAPLAVALAALVLVAAVIVSFIPFARTGSGGPGPNFTALRAADEIAFQMAGKSGIKYSGSFTSGGSKYGMASNPSREKTFEFTDLVVTTSGNAEGTLIFAGHRAQYRVLANRTFVNAPSSFWKAVLAAPSDGYDWANVDDKWVMSKGSGVPNLSALLAPLNMGMRLVTPTVSSASAPGPAVDPDEPRLPDSRFWATQVPDVELTGNTFTIDDLTTTFDPKSRDVTRIVGLYRNYTESAKLDLTVQPASDAATGKVYTGGRALIPELAAVPVIAATPAIERPSAKRMGPCSTSGCVFDVTLTGSLMNASTVVEGYTNYGVKSSVVAGESTLTSDCDRVVRVPLKQDVTYRCTAHGAPPGSTVSVSFTDTKFLPIATYSTAMLTADVDNNQKAGATSPKLVRTGSKLSDAEKYNFQVTGNPSTIGVRAGDYTFDGFSPSGKYYVALAPGYADHVKDGSFDEAWSGYSTLVSQARRQVDAASGTAIIWYVGEHEAVDAFGKLLSTAGVSSIEVSDRPASA